MLEREDVVAARAPAQPKAADAEASEEDQQAAEERDLLSGDPPDDDLIEAIAAEPVPNGQVDVAKLWEILVDAERELATYGRVVKDSVFDRNVSWHKVQFDLLSGYWTRALRPRQSCCQIVIQPKG